MAAFPRRSVGTIKYNPFILYQEILKFFGLTFLSRKVSFYLKRGFCMLDFSEGGLRTCPYMIWLK